MTTNGSGQSSITLATNSKGQVQPEVKVYAPPVQEITPEPGLKLTIKVSREDVRDEAIELARIATVALCKAVDELAMAGVPTVFSDDVVRSMRKAYADAIHGPVP